MRKDFETFFDLEGPDDMPGHLKASRPENDPDYEHYSERRSPCPFEMESWLWGNGKEFIYASIAIAAGRGVWL